MDRGLVKALDARGLDVLSALDAGMIHRADEDHLEYAAAQSRVLYSFNVGDYCRLHKTTMQRGEAHSGIVVARQQAHTVGEQMRALLAMANEVTAEQMMNRLEFLSAWTQFPE